MNVTIAQSPRGATGEDIVMSRTRRAVAAIAVVATLGTGTVTACPGPPPTEEAWTSLWNSIGVVLWINIANALGICFAPCLPVQGPIPATPPALP